MTLTPTDPVLDGCTTCGRTHLTTTNHPACAGHKPCHRRRPTSGRFCVACAVSQADKLGPITTRPITNPLERLAALTGKVEGWLGVAEERLARLTEFGDREGRVHAEVKAFTVIVRNLGFLLGLMSKLDLDERLARLDRVQADQLRDLLELVMRDPELALSQEQQAEWPRAFGRAARLRVGPSVLTVDGEVT